jgi:lysophospholipase L1-like esterase
VVDLYHKKELSVDHLVKFKRLKDPQTGLYKNYSYPGFIDIPFNPETDQYPYPAEAIDMTYDGLHPSDRGYEIIAAMLIKIMKKY